MSTAATLKPISTAGDLGFPATPVPEVIAVGKPTLLTVGAGMEFSTLGEALKAAVNGDTIAVKAGTYTNDFGTVSANVSVIAVGGVVNEVATEPPPDDKGILTVNANLTIEGFTFTGGADNSPDGNVSGIRLQSGNLNVEYCQFSHMQEGLLADPDPTGVVTIDHSTFLFNGTGDGYSHNLYIGAVKSLTVTNSFFEGANVGHEIKSRAASTTIQNNLIIDGPTGTGSYDIDIPNGGVALISGNIIEKGPNASNTYAIHYGGETQYSYAQNSLVVTNNTIINDMASNVISTAVLNSSALNGVTAPVQIFANRFYNYAAQNIAIGAANIYNNTNLTTEPSYNTISTMTGLPSITLGGGIQLLHLATGNHVITGGVTGLILADASGSNTVNGGSGGVQLSANAGWDQITTAANSTNTINTPGRNCTVYSHGNDHINASGAYETIIATGAATIAGGGFSSYTLDGAGEALTTSDSGYLTIGAAGNAHVVDTGGDLALTVAAGGRVVIEDRANTVHGGAESQATISGGAVSGGIANAGSISITTGAAGAFVQAGSGIVSVTGGAGNDTLQAGSGSDVFVLGGGTDSVTFGSGSASVTAGAGADSFVFRNGAGGHDSISGFANGTDHLVFTNFSGNAIASGSIVSGNTMLTLTDGTTIDLIGVTLPGYSSSGSGGPQPSVTGGSGSSGSGVTQPVTPPAIVSSGTTLTSGGHVVTGGATRLSLTDVVGGNTITGGSGGLAVVAGDADKLGTAAGSTNTLSLTRFDTVAGAGTDNLTVSQYANLITETGAATVNLLGTANTVQGGTGLLQVSDHASGDSIFGGAGGMVAALSATYDQVTTLANAADTVSLGAYSDLVSAGTDQISLNGLYDLVTVTGAAGITAGAGYSSFVLDGTDTLTDAGSFAATVGGAAQAQVVSTGSGGGVAKLAGGTVALSQVLPGGGTASVTVSGGAASVGSSGAAYAGIYVTASGGANVTAGAGPVYFSSTASAGAAADTIHAGAGLLLASAGAQGLTLMAGAGNVTLNGGAGTDVFTGGSGTAQLNLGSGADTITFGSGSTTVSGGTADTFVLPGGCAGSATILNWTAQDSFTTQATTDSVAGGSTYLTFSGGEQIELVGITHLN